MADDSSLAQNIPNDSGDSGANSAPPAADPSSAPAQSGALATPPAMPSPQVAAPAYDPQLVPVDGDVNTVPQETVGLEDTSIIPRENQIPAPEPLTSAEISQEPTVFPEVPAESNGDVASAPFGAQPSNESMSSSDDATLPSAPAPASDDEPASEAPAGEKSPLEMLEDILAGAEAEKKAKDDEESKKKAEEEAFQAQFKAKQDQFQVEADARIAASVTSVAESAEERKQKTQELVEQGKIDPVASGAVDDLNAIRQLEHIMPEE